MSTEPLTRETRYEGLWRLSESVRRVPAGERYSSDAAFAEPIYVVRCLSCGSLVAEGSEDLHERIHPQVSCEQIGCEVQHGQLADGTCLYGVRGHPWEDQFR
jgi:hypothetical protein